MTSRTLLSVRGENSNFTQGGERIVEGSQPLRGNSVVVGKEYSDHRIRVIPFQEGRNRGNIEVSTESVNGGLGGAGIPYDSEIPKMDNPGILVLECNELRWIIWEGKIRP